MQPLGHYKQSNDLQTGHWQHAPPKNFCTVGGDITNPGRSLKPRLFNVYTVLKILSAKGQIISEAIFIGFKSLKKQVIFFRISALASKMGQIEKPHCDIYQDRYIIFII